MGGSKLQSLIITRLVVLLNGFFGEDYFVFTNDIGIQFSKKSCGQPISPSYGKIR